MLVSWRDIGDPTRMPLGPSPSVEPGPCLSLLGEALGMGKHSRRASGALLALQMGNREERCEES